MSLRKLELLSPAANATTAIEAIKHGADAVYIGPPSHGARKAAANSIDDIAMVADYAHQFRAKVYATVNTIIYDNEIKTVENLCRDLYHAGVDALIVQDMGILRMKIPPIPLHASTQCDIRTPEKALFLQEVGFSQLVLARELSLTEIRAITETVSIPVETFMHGALCVSYSGRCHASYSINGRSANRGECAQICRLPFSLTDSDGKTLCRDKYLLSLKDFNTSNDLPQLIKAGVSSFKIEGRLKDEAYVKNITSFYNIKLNNFIEQNPDDYQRSSYGTVSLKFQPDPYKSFNRGFTNYFLTDRHPQKIASISTPKSHGEPIREISKLNNGDGISFYDKNGNFQGVNINRIEGSKIIPARRIEIPKDTQIFRTSDVRWNKLLGTETASRKIPVSVTIDNTGITAEDSRGSSTRIYLDSDFQVARQKMDYRGVFEKLGASIYTLDTFNSIIDPYRFYPLSQITALRRRLIELLDKDNRAIYPFEYRKKENEDAIFPYSHLDFRDNVANKLSREFYLSHGVKSIEDAAEISSKLKKGDIVMTTRHCVLREIGLCKKENNKQKIKFPLYLNYDKGKFLLDFDCKNCEMTVRLVK